jgi:energy-converting hydrogenase Eha subunit C
MHSNRCVHRLVRRAALVVIGATIGAAALPAASAWGHPDPPTRTTAQTSPKNNTPTSPTTGSTTAPTGDASSQGDVPALDMGDPFCGAGLSPQQQQNCRISGSVAAPYPTSRYGIDYANPPTGLSSLSPGDWFATTLGTICSLIWEFWLYAIRGVLALLNWAFALRLVQDAMGAVKQGLGVLNGRVFGVPWLEAAISVAGLWGIYHGLVRRKTIETLGGLAVTVVMMVGALVLIAQPDATVGRASAFANQASLTALSGASQANVATPAQGFASAESGLFTALVLRPWCALEFGDVNYCTAPRKVDGGTTTVADMWLAFDPMGPGRQGLYNLATTGSIEQYGGVFGTAAKDLGLVSTPAVTTVAQACSSDPGGDQCKALKAAQGLSCYGKSTTADCAFSSGQSGEVAMQAGGNPLTRMVMLALIVAGLAGAVCVLLYMAIHLVFAAIRTLILLLGAPVMMLVAAFGESGRATFAAWGKRLLGALVTKLVFAVLLALVVLMASALNSLPLQWLPVWLLNIVFWWGLFLQRRAFVDFLTMDKRALDGGLAVTGHGTPARLAGALAAGYYGLRTARTVARGAMALPRAAGRHGAARREADTIALREGDAGELEARTKRSLELAHRESLSGEDRERLEKAEQRIAGHNERVQGLEGLKEERAKQFEIHRTARDPAARKAAEARHAALNHQIATAKQRIDGERKGALQARATVGALMPEFGAAHVERAIAQRRRDLESPFPADDTTGEFRRALLAADISPKRYDAARGVEREQHRKQAQIIWDRDKALLAATDPADSWRPYTRAEVKRGWEDLTNRGDKDMPRADNVALQRALARSYEERRRQRFESQHRRTRPRRPY